MSEPQVEIPAACEIHGGCGQLMIRREGERIILDGRGDQCCMLTLERDAVTLVLDVFGKLR